MDHISLYIYVIIYSFFENYIEHTLLVLFKETQVIPANLQKN